MTLTTTKKAYDTELSPFKYMATNCTNYKNFSKKYTQPQAFYDILNAHCDYCLKERTSQIYFNTGLVSLLSICFKQKEEEKKK